MNTYFIIKSLNKEGEQITTITFHTLDYVMKHIRSVEDECESIVIDYVVEIEEIKTFSEFTRRITTSTEVVHSSVLNRFPDGEWR